MPFRFSAVLPLFLVSLFGHAQQPPTPAELYAKMKQTVAGITTLSYDVSTLWLNNGIADSVVKFSARVWLRKMPADSIFAAHFHIAQQSLYGRSDYYYDGMQAIDVWHEHRRPEAAKKIVIRKPQLLGNGINEVQTSMSVLPYPNELMNPTAFEKLLKQDSLTVREDPAKRFWIVEWPENRPAHNFFGRGEAWIDKNTHLLTVLRRRSTFAGTRLDFRQEVSGLRVNDAADEAQVSLRQTYPDYKTEMMRNKTAGTLAASRSLRGQKPQPFSYPAFDGSVFSSTQRKGKLLLLDFWETWCGYCFVAMPRLKALHEKYGANGLEIVGVVTENKQGVENVIASQKFPYRTVFADEALLKRFEVLARPTYFLLDENGTVVEHSAGSLDVIEAFIKQRLGN